ncbi:MAG: hypothetical protein ACOYBE_07810 [Blautia sp.]
MVSTIVAFVILMLGLAMVTTAVVAATTSMGKANISRQLVHKAVEDYYENSSEIQAAELQDGQKDSNGAAETGEKGFKAQAENGTNFFIPGLAKEYTVTDTSGNSKFKLLFFEEDNG